MDAVLERKLRELIDRNEIWQVMQRYGRGADRCDRELLRSCYFDDATEDHGSFVGAPDEFIDWVFNTAKMLVASNHGLMNHTCELDGDNAYCETYYLSVSVFEKEPHLLSTGRYIDHFQRRNGEWRIANRVAIIESTFDVNDSTVVATLGSIPGARHDRPRPTQNRDDISYHRPPRPRPRRAA